MAASDALLYARSGQVSAVPGGEDIVVSRDPGATGRHEDAHVTIRDAFDAAGRQLQDFAGRR